MEKYFKKSLLVLAILATIVSCTDGGYIGDLLDQWQLEEMTYKGITTKPENRLYLRFQGMYIEAYPVSENRSTGYYERNGDEMLAKFYYGYYRLGNDPAPALEPFNFYNDTTIMCSEEDKKLFGADTTKIVKIRFHIEKLTSDELILSNNDGRWVFKSW